jgi:hypothetical protein
VAARQPVCDVPISDIPAAGLACHGQDGRLQLPQNRRRRLHVEVPRAQLRDLLFKEEELFIKREEAVLDPHGDEPVATRGDDLYIEKAGFRTTARAVKAVLDEYGYTVEFFADIYGSFRTELQATVRAVLEDELGADTNEARERLSDEELQRQVRAHLSASPDTAMEDLQGFTAFLREAIENDLEVQPFLEDVVVGGRGQGDEPMRVSVKDYVRYRATALADFGTLQMLVIKRASRVPANVLRPLMLFDEGYLIMFRRWCPSCTHASCLTPCPMMLWSSSK